MSMAIEVVNTDAGGNWRTPLLDLHVPGPVCPGCGYPRTGGDLHVRYRCGSLWDGKRLVRTAGCTLLEEQQSRIGKALSAVEGQARGLTLRVADGRTLGLVEYIRIAIANPGKEGC